MPQLGGWEFVVLIGVMVLLFGSKKLPDMARAAGQSVRVLKGELKGLKEDDKAQPPPAASSADRAETKAEPTSNLNKPVDP